MKRVATSGGVLVVDKPKGPTSHDVVARLRKIFGTRRVGHAGTLDPMASGVLVVAVDEATKLVPWLTADDKAYAATLQLGIATDTLDAEGKETARVPISESLATELRDVAGGHFDVTDGYLNVTTGHIAEALMAERVRTEQDPPIFSAIRTGGERAHVIARRGEDPELAARPVAVRRLGIVAAGDTHLDLVLDVAKGYYVRALARDFAEALGTVGHLTSLRRTRSGGFTLDDAVPLDDPERLRAALIPIERAAARVLPVSMLSEEGVLAARRGQPVREFTEPKAGTSAWLEPGGRLVAIGEMDADGTGRVLRGIVDRS